jgi:hypothetical protein
MAATAAYAIAGVVAWAMMPGGAGLFISTTTLVLLGCGCSRLRMTSARLPLIAAAFAAFLYLNHLRLNVPFAPARALAAGVVLAIVWASATWILQAVDRAFVDYLPSEPRPV